MNENLPQKYKNNIFCRLISKLKCLFLGKMQIYNGNHLINDFEIKEKTKSKLVFSEQIKFETTSPNEENQKKKFMENLTNNPDLLQNFSNERLEKILQYYLDENEKKRKTLKNLTA